MENEKIKAELFKFIDDEFGEKPEYLWAKTPEYAVFRHSGNRKWFALVMNVPSKCLGLEGNSVIDVINLKSDPVLIPQLLKRKGYLLAYHMNKKNWITIMLDGTVSVDEIINLLKLSYVMTDEK